MQGAACVKINRVPTCCATIFTHGTPGVSRGLHTSCWFCNIYYQQSVPAANSQASLQLGAEMIRLKKIQDVRACLLLIFELQRSGVDVHAPFDAGV